MIRALNNYRVLKCWTATQSCQTYIKPGSEAGSKFWAPPLTFGYRLASTSVSKADISPLLPPNLTFDARSSFAPKVTTIQSHPGDGFDKETAGLSHEHVIRNDNGNVDAYDHDQHLDDSEDDHKQDYDSLCSAKYVVPLPDRLKTNVHYGLDGSISGTLWLESSVFGIDPIRIDLIKQSVDYIRNKIRGRRKAKSKTISEVSGSGRKVRQQKGTGKARAGHSRPAHWRGGAKAHGPKNTVDYGDVKMNKKTKRLAMASVLSQKLKEGNLIIVDNLLLESHKTSPWASVLENTYGIGSNGASALIVDQYHDSIDQESPGETSHASHHGVPINLWVASANVPKVKVVKESFANVYDILKKEKLVITLGALGILEKRLKR